jgi:hypothetical protein
MRESLAALIRAVQADVREADFRGQVEVAAVGGGGRLWFGYGYYSPHNVLWWPPAPESAAAKELSVEGGVAAFLQSVGAES